MQKCEKCSNQFKWGNIIKLVWFTRYLDPIICNKCNSKHYVNFETKLIAILSAMFPIFFVSFIYEVNRNYFILFYIIWIPIMMLITPFYAKYHMHKND